MSALIDPATLDLVWTLAAAGGLVGLAALCLFALPWTDQEIAQMDSAFRTMGEITTETVPLRTTG
jgi:hypothetical protein